MTTPTFDYRNVLPQCPSQVIDPVDVHLQVKVRQEKEGWAHGAALLPPWEREQSQPALPRGREMQPHPPPMETQRDDLTVRAHLIGPLRAAPPMPSCGESPRAQNHSPKPQLSFAKQTEPRDPACPVEECIAPPTSGSQRNDLTVPKHLLGPLCAIPQMPFQRVIQSTEPCSE